MTLTRLGGNYTDSHLFLFCRESFPIVLVANKVDLLHLRKISSDQGKEMASKHDVSVKESL